MKYFFYKSFWQILLCLCISIGVEVCSNIVFAQTSTTNTTQGYGIQPKKDTNLNKSNTNKWKNEDARITYEKLNSAKIYIPDSSLHTFQRLAFNEPWIRDMGNLGSPSYNLLFTPAPRFGPSLGYHVNDALKYNIDSLNYYNTNRPYSVFSYRLGSKLEQMVSLMHTQNIKPNWNIAIEYRRITAPGYYKIQRNNHDNLYLTSNFKSLNKHYAMYIGMVYNQEQHDENGGMTNVKELDTVDINGNVIYNDRRTLDAINQNDVYSISRSSVYNNDREFTFLLQHSYTWGNTDTAYNADSTQYSFQIKPRFSITHQLEISSEKHTYNDLTPDSLRYTTLFNHAFSTSGSGYYTAGQDSVFTQQKWIWVDNKFLFNGFLGKEGNQIRFSAGIGTRYDQFTSLPVSNQVDSLPNIPYTNKVYITGQDQTSLVHNYIEGLIKKEALKAGEWGYGADAKLFVTGRDAGNFNLNAVLGKELPNNNGGLWIGFSQKLNSAPYSYTNYENLYTKDTFPLNPESISMVYATIESPRLRLSGGVRSYLINNYIYLAQNDTPTNYNIPFNIVQTWVRKVFKIGKFYFDNEFAYQQQGANTPINVPTLMGRHQISYENALFKRALKVEAGLEIRYTTDFKPAGYDVLLNQFYYQNSVKVSNTPEVSFFFNFRIRNRFRAFIMADQLQQLLPHVNNNLLYVGNPINTTDPYPVSFYATPNTMVRAGFAWVLVN